jgi:hypothetical protein
MGLHDNVRRIADAHSKGKKWTGKRDLLDSDESDNEYSQEKFYTRATDGDGQTRSRGITLRPSIAAAIDALVQSGRIPEYTTVDAFMRDAAYHRLWKVTHDEHMTGDIKLLKSLQAQEKSLQIKARNDANKILIDSWETVLRQLEMSDDKIELAELCDSISDTIPTLNHPWNEKAIVLLNRAKGRLL